LAANRQLGGIADPAMFCTGKSAAMSGIWGLLIANDIFNPKITGLRMSKGWILRQEIWKL